MDHGYKHFSHSHNLIMHQLPEGIDVSCSGCNSSGNGTVFICWQCNFFLHEQCYRATRSFKHPSHPPHPLTLIPYPTYPSNSFYCNSCEIIGTGLSYSCAHCEFDLHVQCAYSISRATSFQNSQHYPTNYSINGQISSMANNVPVVYSVTSPQYPFMPSVSIPTNSQDSVTGTQYHPSVIQPTPSVSIPAASPPNLVNNTMDPSNPQNRPSVSIPTSSQNPVPSPLYPPVDVSSVSIPTNNPDPITTDEKINMASVYAPSASPDYNQPDNQVESGPNQLNHKHFSHPHSLRIVNLQDEENDVDCSGCEDTLDGNCYSCVEPNCDFHLHESCFHLKQQIQHKSHPEHPLTLLPLAPCNNENGEFTCNACFSDGTGFTYHCSICKFDLHIQCVSLPETVERSDHEHKLKLYYSCPVEGEEYTFCCDVCHVAVQKDRWTYYCEACDYGTHLGCVDCDECVADSVVDMQMQLQRLQLQVEMSRQQAQMVASMGASLLSLV